MFQLGKRGRKVGSDGEKSRELLLTIAAKQFASHGFHNTKISTIVKEANVTQPTFYLYFKSKDAIFQELIGIFKDKLQSQVEQSRLASDIEEEGLLDRIAHGITLIFRLFQDNEQIARIGFIAADDATDIKARMAAQIKENLVVEVDNGYFHSNIDLGIVSTAIVGVIEHLTVTRLWTNLNTPEELSREMTRLFLHGLKKET